MMIMHGGASNDQAAVDALDAWLDHIIMTRRDERRDAATRAESERRERARIANRRPRVRSYLWGAVRIIEAW